MTALTEHLQALMNLHRQRRYNLQSEIALDNQLGSQARYYANPTWTDGTMTKPTPEHIEQAKRDLPALVESITTITKTRKQLEKHMEKLTTVLLEIYLPSVRPLLEHRGISLLTIAQILAEGGVRIFPDGTTQGLERFTTKGKLFKRFGLAVIEGQRQRRIAGNPELALRHAFNPSRRAVLWNVGRNLMMQLDPTYKKMYDERKALELARDIPAFHADRRARRYISKSFLKKFWQAYCRDVQTGTASRPGITEDQVVLGNPSLPVHSTSTL